MTNLSQASTVKQTLNPEDGNMLKTRPIDQRRFIRHPSDIPIEICGDFSVKDAKEQLKDVSNEGLSFTCEKKLDIGQIITIRISSVTPPFNALARVCWCHPQQGRYSIGIQFKDGEELFRVRMVEQICHIEHYKRQVWEQEGRKLDGEQAAMEWIEKYAADFPASG